MPLPLILPSVPPAPELAEVVLVSSAEQARQLRGNFPAIAADPDTALDEDSLADAQLLLPLAQSGEPTAAPTSISPLPLPLHATGDNPEPEQTLPAPEATPEAGPEDSSAPEESEPPPQGAGTLVLQADRQTYEPIRQIVTATGNVQVQFGTSQITADRLWANLANRYLRAEGNVFFNRNSQIVEGEAATYNLLQGSGTITNSRGELQLQTLGTDFATLGGPVSPGTIPLDYRLQPEGTISQVTSTGGIALATGDPRPLLGDEQTTIRRLRFESDQLYFDADGWYADQLRLTNDPFSPPDLEFRAENVRLTPLNAEQDELVFANPRLVLDQGLSIPLTRRRFVLTRGQLPADAFNPLPTGIGIDGRDRDGLYIEREIPLAVPGPLTVTVAPQFLVSRWLGDSQYNIGDPANFGLTARVEGNLSPRTSATGTLSLAGLDLANWRDRLRGSFRAQQLLGNHRLNLEYSYRDRLFNGSLGFQDVQSSLGALLASPDVVLGGSGILLRYQASGQYVTASTDRSDLLSPGVASGLASLFRFQGAADVSRGFLLWSGPPLPATATEGLRYSPNPVVPKLGVVVGLRGVATYYTSNDLQETLEARVAFFGQLGHLQRNTFDYTQFNIGFSRTFLGGDTSPFFFDRVVDRNVLSGGITQQIYGPVLLGFQTSMNVDTGRTIDTNIILEYRRRAYGLLLTYSPTQETGFLGFRISDFDWVGRTAPFDADSTAPSDVQVQ